MVEGQEERVKTWTEVQAMDRLCGSVAKVRGGDGVVPPSSLMASGAGHVFVCGVPVHVGIESGRLEPRANLSEILGRPRGHRRGVGNSFQPAIDASR